MAKFVKVMEWIVKDKLLASVQVFQPTEPCYEAVTQVHTKDFVDSFIKGSLPFDEMRKTGFHWSQGLVKRCFLEVGMYFFDDGEIEFFPHICEYVWDKGKNVEFLTGFELTTC